MSDFGYIDVDQRVDHPLYGKRVRVVLARAGQCASPHQCTDGRSCAPLANDEAIIGVLLRLDAGGEVRVRQDDGIEMSGWPALEITESPARDE